MVARTLIIVALVPVTAFYLFPRVYNLVATPYRLDQTIISASNYNPALTQIVAHEEMTVAAFGALDQMNTALHEVLAIDATVAAELNTLIGQNSGDVQRTLYLARTNVSELVAALDILARRISSVQPPVVAASSALADNRATLAAILDDARSTAAKVHGARVSAESAADDLSGK
ncbi:MULTISPECIES: hypothetical protein [Nocardia]|uniref:hypothetical protein n=1 Tax=Nocardia TaxID=1817 RepID=UPI0007EAD78A|nr:MULTISPECIES: hypothetical protein [Nocardia]MBF6278409.1 hypothetical protein [Nocardia nova]OBA47849.1 hypothetical protein A5789_34645 [Nocardia sp. 852002-51101_SCH5132738]OBB30251.1 hypothetical protein A5748_08930 [Nocardia sp. 852002-51244_SCH5132740]OBF68006.1 hypothetical protein A9X06_35115 [Mycobacterium sp. 852002-51759_SCH5129042]